MPNDARPIVDPYIDENVAMSRHAIDGCRRAAARSRIPRGVASICCGCGDVVVIA
jgi:hypothetical protein